MLPTRVGPGWWQSGSQAALIDSEVPQLAAKTETAGIFAVQCYGSKSLPRWAGGSPEQQRCFNC